MMDEGRIKGTIRYYGTPAEENIGGKMFMAREGCFDDLDICLNWHPWYITKSHVKNSQSILDYHIRFHGVTAHASSDPWDGRSALDGVEAFTHGINLLREHVKPTVRMHYNISHGGLAPNVVPEFAEVWFWARDNDMKELLKLDERIKKIIHGASEIAGVDYEIKFNGGMYNVLSLRKSAEALQTNLELLGPVEFTQEDIEFAYKLQAAAGVEVSGLKGSPLTLEEALEHPKPFASDVGDISWNVPLMTLYATSAPYGIPWHSWCVVVSSGMSIGHKGMIYAAKAMALTMLDLYQDPKILKGIQAEFREKKGDFQYRAMLPEGPPPIPDRPETMRD